MSQDTISLIEKQEGIQVSVIVPVWNRADLTMQWMAVHWARYRQRLDVEVIVIDNGSIDTTPAVLKQWAKAYGDQLVIIRHDENMGFGGGNNAGAAIARGNVLVFTSNDVVVEGDYLEKIEARLKGHDVLLGAQMLTHDTGWNRFRGVEHKKEELTWKEPEPTVIPYLAGHLIAANKSTWERIGGWDERYFPSDYEDLDVSYRAITLGISLLAIPLPIKHLFGQSAAQISGGREQVTLRNRRQFMEKWELREP